MSYIMVYAQQGQTAASVRIEEHAQTVVDRLNNGWRGWELEVLVGSDLVGQVPVIGRELKLGVPVKVSETHMRLLLAEDEAGDETLGEGRVTVEEPGD